MSTEIQKFYGMALKNPALVNDLTEITDLETYAKKAVELGAANGCNFNEAEFAVWSKEKAAALANNELDDQELEAVAGGGWGFMRSFKLAVASVGIAAGAAATGMGMAPVGVPVIIGSAVLADRTLKNK